MAELIAGRYEVIEKLGEGGMGAVYKVRHPGLRTILAVKLLPEHLAKNEEFVARFEREARVMARLKHEGIVQVIDINREGNVYYLVEEFLEGQHLGQYIRTKHPLPFSEILDIAYQVAEALKFAHEHGVVHRDVKPANIIIENSLPLRARVIDFGIAKDLGDDSDGVRTRTGVLMGTLRYAAPEQLGYSPSGRKLPIDGRADIYALGLVIYEMCEGKAFFAGMDQQAVLVRVLRDNEALVPHFSRSVPPVLSALVTRAIRRDPGQRYPSMADLLTDLDSCMKPLVGTARGPTSLSARTADPQPAPSGPPDARASGEVTDEDLDARIRQLEEERQRRLAFAAQAQAESAREAAAAAGAAQLAASLFKQGAVEEELAVSALGEARYARARELFEHVVDVFTKAAAEAAAAQRVRQAQQARTTMLEIKRDAERRGAAEKARSLFSSAQQLETEAEERWKRQAYDDATRSYLDAQRLYERARDHARSEGQREAAEQARSEMLAARTAAVDVDPDQFAGALEHEAGMVNTRVAGDTAVAPFAVALFLEARGLESRGEAALAETQFAGAQELFTAAARGYERAAREARQQRLQQRVLALQAEAQRASEAAGDAQAPRYASGTLAEATKVQEQAEAALSAADHEAALEAFQEAIGVFQRAAAEATYAHQHADTSAAEREQQRLRTQNARTKALAAQTAADRADAARLATDLYDEGRTAFELGDTARRGGEHLPALLEYERAADHFTRAATEAEREGQMEAVGSARAAVIAGEQAALEAGAPGACEEQFEAALARKLVAENDLARGDFSKARREFEAAAAQLRQVASDLKRHTADTPAPPETAVTRPEATAPTIELPTPKLSWPSPLYLLGGLVLIAAVAGVVMTRRGTEERPPLPQPSPRGETSRPTEPPVNRPPVIASTSPDTPVVSLEAGAAQRFSIIASDPDADLLKYKWERNGFPVASGDDAEWTLPSAQAADTEVRVTVADSAGHIVGPHVWKMAVLKPPPPPNRPPRIVGESSPNDQLVRVDEGRSVDFSVTATDPDGDDQLAYEWFFDGRSVAHSPQWHYAAERVNAAMASHSVAVDVSDKAGARAPRVEWNVEVRAVGPKIVDSTPGKTKVSLMQGQTERFSVRTKSNGDDVRHEWRLDGTVQASEETSFRLPATLSVGSHPVTVAAVDARGLRSSPQEWIVNIRAPGAPPPPVAIVPTAGPLPVDGLLEAEVRDWFSRVERAWGQKDTGTLLALGAISSDQVASTKAILDKYDKLQVAIKIESIQINGRTAVVAYARRDTVENGKVLPYPPLTVTLEKRPSGVVGR